LRSSAAGFTQAVFLADHIKRGGAAPSSATLENAEMAVAQLNGSMERLLDAIRSMPEGTYLQGHFAYNLDLYERIRDLGIPMVFLYRDPRDCVLSMANFLCSRGEPADLLPRLNGGDVDAALRLFIAG